MRVVVDRDRCEGNAICVKIAPEVFTLDDDEYATVTADPVPVELETLAEHAIAECPRAALARKTRRRKISSGEVDRRPTPSVLRVDSRPSTSP